MTTKSIEADYLVVGAGAVGMAFTDALITDSRARVCIVDRRHAPGGHWNDAYPFVRLHQPSAYYGVNSTPLGEDLTDRFGGNEGLLERASASEICGYYNRVMDHRLLPSGQVEYHPMCDYIGDHLFVSRLSGAKHQVSSRATVVEANYLEPALPSTEPPPFEVAEGARCIPINELARLREPPARYVIVGAGKTAIDACLWLLERDVPPERIRWIKPRECWLVNRAFSQSGERVGSIIEGAARQMEAAARSESIDELFRRLHASEQLLRVDESVEPSMFKYATVSAREIEQLRRIEDVVRLGHVKRIEKDAIVLERGSVPTAPDHVHVHCAAAGLKLARPIPVFGEGRITLQPIRTAGLVPFNAAIAAYVEATRTDLAEKNRLCPPNPFADTPIDWLRATVHENKVGRLWSGTPDIAAWLERSRLNLTRGLAARASEPDVLPSLQRYLTHVKAGIANLERLMVA